MVVASPLIKVRSACTDDGAPLAGVFRDCWRYTYAGIIPPMHLDQLIRKRSEMWWRTTIQRDRDLLVLDAAGTVAGYATFGKARASRVYQGEIFELYLAPVYQGIGFGEHMFEACRNRLDDRNMNGLIVWALADNDAAVDFYWRRGGRPVAESQEQFGTKKLNKIAFAWK